jgi:Gamma-glutamyltranspeptidase
LPAEQSGRHHHGHAATRLIADYRDLAARSARIAGGLKDELPNLHGLMQGEANAIAPSKRPLSSMRPTIVTKDGRPVMVVGTPGGSHIITACCRP